MSAPLLVAIRCPQCAAETDFPEGAHALECAYCGVKLRIVGAHRGGRARFLMRPTVEARAVPAIVRAWAAEQGRRLESLEWQTLVLAPFWHARGIAMRWVYYRPDGPPPPRLPLPDGVGAATGAPAANGTIGGSERLPAHGALVASRTLLPHGGSLGPGGVVLRVARWALSALLGVTLEEASTRRRVRRRSILDEASDGIGRPFEGLGVSLPGGTGPGTALDARDLQARHFDLSFPAFDGAHVGLVSLGVRAGVRPLNVLAPDVLPPGARMLPLSVEAERALALVAERTGRQFDAVPGHPLIDRRALVVRSLGAVYFPLWVATVRLDGAERCLVVDAVAGSVVHETAPTEAWIAELPGRAAPPIAAASLGFLPLKCPECAHDLPLETNALAHLCVRCGRAFAEAGGRLISIPYEAVAARGAALYLPAWRFEATLTLEGRRLAGAADLPRLFKPVGWPLPPRDPTVPDRPASIYVPAFECRDLGIVDRLGAAWTRLQPDVGGRSGVDRIPLSPPPRVVGAAVEAADAEGLARLILVALVPGAGPAARKRLESLEATLGEPRLVWFPVHDRGRYLQDRLTGVSLRKAALGWAPPS